MGQPLPRQMELIDTENADLLLEAYRSHHEQHHDALIGSSPVSRSHSPDSDRPG